jgi:hypothetical protein
MSFHAARCWPRPHLRYCAVRRAGPRHRSDDRRRAGLRDDLHRRRARLVDQRRRSRNWLGYNGADPDRPAQRPGHGRRALAACRWRARRRRPRARARTWARRRGRRAAPRLRRRRRGGRAARRDPGGRPSRARCRRLRRRARLRRQRRRWGGDGDRPLRARGRRHRRDRRLPACGRARMGASSTSPMSATAACR